jgi:hypothetical protein
MKLCKLQLVPPAIILLLALQTIASPPSYPLHVRSGGGLRYWAESTQTPKLVKVIVTFQFGTRPAGSGLRPGQGSWLDRGMRSGEPTRLEYYVQERDAQQIFDYLRTPGNYYVFECFNTGKGSLQATKAYPKSVRID